MFSDQGPRGSTIAATDVADSVPWLYLGLCGDLSGQMASGFLGCFRVLMPEAVVNMLTPDLPVKGVQIIVVSRDFNGSKW